MLRESSGRILYLSLTANLLLVLFVAFVGYGVYPFAGISRWLLAERKNYEESHTSAISGSIYSVYRPPQHIQVVLLGDSIIRNVNWNELLSRSDVAGRGTQSATVSGTLARFDHILRLKPDVVLIHLGINDIVQGHSLQNCLSNYTKLIRRLEGSGIRPIISAALPVSDVLRGHREINRQVFVWNGMLKAYAEQGGFTFLDVNSEMVDNWALRSELTYDGVHLLGPGYALWREGIVGVLRDAEPDLRAAQLDAMPRQW